MTLHHPVEASFRAGAQEIEPGQEEALDNLAPGVLLGSRATRAANGLCLRGAGLESLEKADELAWIRRLEHKSIAARDRGSPHRKSQCTQFRPRPSSQGPQ